MRHTQKPRGNSIRNLVGHNTMARPRKPTHLKVVAGTDQPCRTNKKEPKPRRERPSPPAHLSDKAKTAWGAAAVILDRMGVLTEADGFALEGLCEALADLHQARSSLARPIIGRRLDKETGEENVWTIAEAGELRYVSFGKDGVMVRQRPEVAMIADADRRVSMWLAKFGLTPADRSRVSSSKDDGDDPFGGLLG